MPARFDLPPLSDKNYASLQQELTAAIPQYSSNWTDFNYSDPGIALLQLLCWLGDMTLYRIDTVPRALYLNFLRWVVGANGAEVDGLIALLQRDVARYPDGTAIVLPIGNFIVLDPERLSLAQYLATLQAGASADPTQLRARVMAYWQAPYRAVTTEDFAALTMAVTAGVPDPSPGYTIGRAVVLVDPPYIRVIPVTIYPWRYRIRSDLRRPRYFAAPLATLTAILVSDGAATAPMYVVILAAVRAYLEPRRLAGTPVVVERPVMTPLALRIQFARIASRDPVTLLNLCYAALQALLSPFTGGPDGAGWPYDRPVTTDDIEAVILSVDGVDTGQPIHVGLDTMIGLRVGAAHVNVNTYLGRPDQPGLPQLWRAVIQVVDNNWPFEIGVHSTLGIDSRVGYPAGSA